MDRPRRSTSTVIDTGPLATWATKVVCRDRSTWVGSPSASLIARRASAVTMPPWGSGRRFHELSMTAS